MTLNHLHLAATDLAATCAFYEDLFGFTFEAQHGRAVFIRDAAGFLIAIDPVETVAALPDWFHLGFCQGDEAAVFRLYEKVKVEQRPVVRDMMSEAGQYAAFYVADPDGRRIEVSWHAAEA